MNKRKITSVALIALALLGCERTLESSEYSKNIIGHWVTFKEEGSGCVDGDKERSNATFYLDNRLTIETQNRETLEPHTFNAIYTFTLNDEYIVNDAEGSYELFSMKIHSMTETEFSQSSGGYKDCIVMLRRT